MKWWHVALPPAGVLFLGFLAVVDHEQHKKDADCDYFDREAELYGGYTGWGVRLSEDGKVIFESYGYLTGGQARNVAAEFCENAKTPDVEVNIDRTLFGILGNKLTCESVAGHNFARATLGLTGASGSISGKELTDISDGYEHLNYDQARGIALNHCKHG